MVKGAVGEGSQAQFDSRWPRMLGCFGLHSISAPSHQSRRGQSHLSAQPRTERGHNDGGPRPGCRGEEHRSPTSCARLGDGSLGRHARPRHNAGGAPRVCSQGQPPQEAVVRRHRRCGPTTIDLLAVAPKTVCFWVDQASLMWSVSSAHWNHSKKPLFYHFRVATCWSSWLRVAPGRRSGLRGSGERRKTSASSATKA